MGRITKDFNRARTPTKDGSINRRADRGFDLVMDLFAEAMGERCIGTERRLLHKKLFLQNFHYLKKLDLSYTLENRFWERSYNLEIYSELETNDLFQEEGECLFEVDAKGRFRVHSVTWKYMQGTLNSEQAQRYVDRLNHPLILERICALDLSHIQVEHRSGSGKWRIQFHSMLGSTTWVLIPPILQTIKPKPAEFIKMVEFLDLTADAVINNRL